MKKLVSLTLALAMTLSLCACNVNINPAGASSAEDGQKSLSSHVTHKITSASFPLCAGEEELGMDMTLYFLDDATDLPYIESKDLQTLLNDALFEAEESGISVSMDTDDSTVTYTRHNKDEKAFDNNIPMTIDFDAETIEFMDFDLFCKKPGSSTLLDMTAMKGFNDAGEPRRSTEDPLTVMAMP